MIDIVQIREFMHLAQSRIDDGVPEDVLRHLLSSRLDRIFLESPWWIQDHILGTETYLHFADLDGTERAGFADTVVGKTAVEYEKNLEIMSIFQEGYHQVKEYCAALVNIGIPVDEIYGVLSDTIRWYGYSILLVGEVEEGNLYGADNIQLTELEHIDLTLDTTEEFLRFEQFSHRFFGREQSRLLSAKSLVIDFGIDSTFYRNNIGDIVNLVDTAMSERPIYADLIKSLWQNFVAYLGVSDYGEFSNETYVNELYLITVAKIICVNILNGLPIISDENEMRQILNGEYFAQQNIVNLVDYDYYGWLNDSPYLEELIVCGISIQRQLVEYDYSFIVDEDLFGELLAQLANREHRLLLGQDFTPHWVANQIVTKSISELPADEMPRILDMCCGSGVFLIESIRNVRDRYSITFNNYDEEKDRIVFSCVMGFDIDPLAVMLAKVNWVLSMRDLFSLHTGEIIIPVYHADSLFAATPITHNIPDNELENYCLNFDGNQIMLPAFLLSSQYRKVFESFMSKCYRVAMNRAEQIEYDLNDTMLTSLISTISRESEVILANDQNEKLVDSARNLILQLEQLQRDGRNGIWYFILSNSYRPGLSKHQFNCIVSNPPWLAMSKLANNPYKEALSSKAALYGIRPTGPAHLHMELGTTFLLNAIDKYLQDNGVWSCVMPGSLLSGFHHESLRQERYRNGITPVQMQINEIWELPKTTFKNKAIVLSGKKIDCMNPTELNGRIYKNNQFYDVCTYNLITQGNRSAWTNHEQVEVFADLVNDNPMIFTEGADVFPRTALFHTMTLQQNGNWNISRIEQTSELNYLVNDVNINICTDLCASDFENAFVFDCLISKHLSPFYVSNPAKVIIPAIKNEDGWRPINQDDMALMNRSTEYVFNNIQREIDKSFTDIFNRVINIRGKLKKQKFALGNWLVLSSAGGTNPCAAYINLNDFDSSKLIIDQTLYWYLAENEQEAIYIVGMLNSNALASAIKDFQPQGEFGPRHIHTIPYKIIPKYDEDNPAHTSVVDATIRLMDEWRKIEDNSITPLLQPNSGRLNSRRRRQQAAIRMLESYTDYNNSCNAIFGLD